MQKSNFAQIDLVSRLFLGFLFIYHGLVPKLLWLNAIEVELVSASGLDVSADLISPLAGVAELALGVAIIVFKKSVIPIHLAALVLAMLLVYVGFSAPQYLIAAFNPVTTNIMGLGFCYVILLSMKKRKP
ncbi:DoxX-like family protein [Aurantivibrio plasticivorans]